MSLKLLLCTVFLSGLLLIKLSYRNDKVIRFNEYLLKFNKHYSEKEYKERFRYFEASLKQIEVLNSAQRGMGAKYGLTKFSDWSKDELMSQTTYLGSEQSWCTPTVRNKANASRKHLVLPATLSDELPEKVDWRDGNYLGPVQNQKKCNGCWAFAIVGAMQAMAAIQGKGLQQLSVQELLDCSTTDGCNGGNIEAAMKFLKKTNFNITTEDNYPLMLISRKCSKHPANGRGITHYHVSCRESDAGLMSMLVKGPVIAVINPETWTYYNDGIILYNCPETPMDFFYHVVLIVGYDTTNDVPFYVVKNSWGEDWGEKGYTRLAMGADNVCGIRNHLATVDVN